MRTKLLTIREESLPFIVAIKGTLAKLRQNVSHEVVVGFAYAEGYFGLGKLATARGLRRYTCKIHFYVKPDHLRKGVGRALLDRLLQVTCSQHVGKDGYDWVIESAADEKTYGIGGLNGDRRFQQLVIQRPIEAKNDPDYTWLKQWLESKFYFKQCAYMDYTCRSTTIGAPARWLDMVVFQLQASLPTDFDNYI
jgi:GNAT superfamily N-acetyltransferase